MQNEHHPKPVGSVELSIKCMQQVVNHVACGDRVQHTRSLCGCVYLWSTGSTLAGQPSGGECRIRQVRTGNMPHKRRGCTATKIISTLNTPVQRARAGAARMWWHIIIFFFNWIFSSINLEKPNLWLRRRLKWHLECLWISYHMPISCVHYMKVL